MNTPRFGALDRSSRADAPGSTPVANDKKAPTDEDMEEDAEESGDAEDDDTSDDEPTPMTPKPALSPKRARQAMVTKMLVPAQATPRQAPLQPSVGGRLVCLRASTSRAVSKPLVIS